MRTLSPPLNCPFSLCTKEHVATINEHLFSWWTKNYPSRSTWVWQPHGAGRGSAHGPAHEIKNEALEYLSHSVSPTYGAYPPPLWTCERCGYRTSVLFMDIKNPHRLPQHGEGISDLYDGHTSQKRGQIALIFCIMPKGIILGAVQGLQAKSCKTSTLHCRPASPSSPSTGRVASHRGEPYHYHS